VLTKDNVLRTREGRWSVTAQNCGTVRSGDLHSIQNGAKGTRYSPFVVKRGVSSEFCATLYRTVDVKVKTFDLLHPRSAFLVPYWNTIIYWNTDFGELCFFFFLWQFRWWNGGIIWHRDEVNAGWRQGVAAWRKEATPNFSLSLYCLVYVFPRIPIRLALYYTEISRQNLLSQYVMSNQVTNKFAGVEA
jgi:hypothetical protein